MLRIYDFKKERGDVQRLLTQNNTFPPELLEQVAGILRLVQEQGDRAVREFTRRFDGADLPDFRVKEEEIDEAYRKVSPDFLPILKEAVENIRKFHEKQLTNTFIAPEEDGVILGHMVTPLERVGLYVPGGTAAYPSSVLMNAIPAQVAGVREMVICAPPARDGSLNPYTLVAAHTVGVQEIYKVGGAQAVGAMAYGTETLKKVEKITGPGNIYVTIAKKMVYGIVDIDMLAGPSEIMVLADETANPCFVAADLLSQAEHDPRAAAICVTTSSVLAEKIRQEIEKQTATLSRKEIIVQALTERGGIIIVENLEEGIEVVNAFAPEHLEVAVKEPMRLLGKIKAAGAIFLGEYSPEPVGDYFAGPNHVLPTGGTAKFYSSLSVDHFRKRSSIIYYSKERLLEKGKHILRFAEIEGLDAHANAIRVRLTN